MLRDVTLPVFFRFMQSFIIKYIYLYIMNSANKALLTSVLLLPTLLTCCTIEKKVEPAPSFPKEIWQDGDIVFRRGGGVVSRVVLIADSEGVYSHIGIVVKEGDKWQVVHAVPGEPDFKGDPDRVKMEDINCFFDSKKASRGAVMRVNGDSTLRKHAADRAKRLFRAHTLFDHSYNRIDSTQMYCTELVDFVYRHEGIDLTEGRISHINVPGVSGDYLLPSDIQQSKYLNLIYYF